MGTLPKIMSYQRRPGPRQVAWTARLGGKSIAFTGCSEHICEKGRAAGGAWHAIHNFVDTSKYTFRDTVPPDAPLVFLSRIERIKGAHMAIKVARTTGRRLLMAGNHGTSGEEGAYWKSEIEPQLGDGVEYVGAVNDEQKNDLLGRAAAMIVPIEWDEPFGIVFAESLACGTPVISCPRGALPEIVRDGVDGFLVRDLAQACQAVEALPRISRRTCRQRAQESFSQSVIASRYEDLYREMASGRP
jgi:glycosyltransferase involved in cell wall biosynthesis